MEKRSIVSWMLFLLLIPVVSGELLVIPQSRQLSVVRGQESVFQMTLINNNTFPIYNISFTNVSGFVFPSIPLMNANESRIVSFSVLTQDLFNSVFVSTVSYLYVVPFAPSPSSFQVNMSGLGFFPSEIFIASGDSVVWNNLMSEPMELMDLGSGFSQVSVPALSATTVQYPSVAEYDFYNSPYGYTGYMQVLERSNSTFAHDSGNDVLLSFSVNSALASGALQINLIGNLSANNNQSLTGYLQVINTDQAVIITGIRLSANRWVSNFSDNDFSLPPSTPSQQSSRLVSFIVQPYVEKTNSTNRTQNIVFSVSSSNAGNFTQNIPVFINYANLDVINIGGVNYTLHVLGVTDTIDACLQHMNDKGYEDCLRLKSAFQNNVTVVKEIEAQYRFAESEIKNIKGQLVTFGDISQRLENKMNLYLDKQAMVESKVDNNSVAIDSLNAHVIGFEERLQKAEDARDVRYWVTVIVVVFSCLFFSVFWLVGRVKYSGALERASQL